MKVEFRYCPSCGAALRPRQVEGHQLPACPDCDFVAWRDPKVAVTLVAIDPEGRVLAIRRGIPPGAGGWALPGGYLDDAEEPASGAVRECREETGCDVAVDGFLGVFHVVTDEGGLLVLAYCGRLVDGVATPTPEAPELGWFEPRRLPDLVFSSHRCALDAWRAQAAGAG